MGCYTKILLPTEIGQWKEKEAEKLEEYLKEELLEFTGFERKGCMLQSEARKFCRNKFGDNNHRGIEIIDEWVKENLTKTTVKRQVLLIHSIGNRMEVKDVGQSYY